MSTRATITVSDENDSFDIYQHHDGYPDGPYGLVRHIAMAQRLAWDLPRFEAADFAAAVVGVLKDRGGSTYLTENAKAHSDRDYHYHVEPTRADVSTQVKLTIQRPGFQTDDPAELFSGSISEAITTFDAIGETAKQPREYQILMEAAGTLHRAYDEISALCGERPDDDTLKVYEDIDDATRALMRLRQHFETMSPWRTLKSASDTSVTAKLAWEAHQRFQRG